MIIKFESTGTQTLTLHNDKSEIIAQAQITNAKYQIDLVSVAKALSNIIQSQ